MTTNKRTGYSWNLGGLLGSALGCSAWMFLTPFFADWGPAGIVAAALCVASIVLSVLVLWRMRGQIEALRGIFIFLAVAFLATSAFLVSAYLLNLPVVVSWPPLKLGDASGSFWILLLFPALAILLWVISGLRKNLSEQDETDRRLSL